MTQDFYVTLDANFASSFPGLEWSFYSKEGSSLSISPIEDNSNNLVKKMEPTECAKVEPPAPAAAASASSVSLPSSQQSSVPAATDASAASTAQRNHPNASNGNSAFAVAAASQASNAKAVAAAAAKEDRPSASASTAVEHKIGSGELDSEVKECKKTVGSESASEAARSDSAGNNNFPKKASVEEEKNKAVEMGPMDPANKGKINAE